MADRLKDRSKNDKRRWVTTFLQMDGQGGTAPIHTFARTKHTSSHAVTTGALKMRVFIIST